MKSQRIAVWNIRFIRKLASGGFVWVEGDLRGRIKCLAVLLTKVEDICVVEVAETSRAPVESMIPGESCHEADELVYSGIVVVPEEEIDDLLVALL